MTSRVFVGCLLVLATTVFMEATRAAEKTAKFSMSLEEFRKLSETDQKALLVKVFEHRLQHAKNLKYEALQKINVSEWDGSKPGKVIVWANGELLRHSVLNDSFRMESIRGGVDVSKPTVFSVRGFDHKTGILRCTVKSSDRLSGRITKELHWVSRSHHYPYYLDGKHTTEAQYIFRYLVEHKDEYVIEIPASKSTVKLSVAWYCPWSEIPLGIRNFDLSPEKGFLPVHGKGRWDEVTQMGESWRMEEFFVEDSQLVGDVWMPTQLTEIIAASSGGGKICNFYHITVPKIEAGNVTREDLDVPFSAGMEIVDEIKGVTYKFQLEGQPIP